MVGLGGSHTALQKVQAMPVLDIACASWQSQQLEFLVRLGRGAHSTHGRYFLAFFAAFLPTFFFATFLAFFAMDITSFR